MQKIKMNYTIVYGIRRFNEGNVYTVDEKTALALTSGNNPPARLAEEDKSKAEKPAKKSAKKK